MQTLGFLSATLRLLRRQTDGGAGRKAAAASAMHPKINMLSSVTNVPFSAECQVHLRKVAKQNKYSNRYWVTLPQSRRTCGATILPGEPPTTIYLNVERVVALKALSTATQKRILDEYPPFFGSGVGILSRRKKWCAVTAERLIRVLNRNEEDRALYIDVNIAKDLHINVKAKDIVDIRNASYITVFNAEQLDDPYKGEPQKGVALDASTGKRFGQPAHDILLGVGIMRGYISPMWVAEKQMKHLNLQLKEHAHREGVMAPNMTGIIVSLSVLPPAAQAELLAELKRHHPDAFGCDLFFIYNVNGWEVTRARNLVKHMAAINDPKYPFHFVNLKDFQLQKPKYAEFVYNFVRRRHPIGAAILQRVVDEKSVHELTEGRLALQVTHTRNKGGAPFFFAEDATLRRYFNATAMTQPHLTVPSVRAIAVLNGRLVGRRDETILRSFALEHKLSSPLWLTESVAHRMGVRILPKYQKKFVTIGAAAAEVNPDEDAVEGFYNLSDFVNQEEVLSLFPKASKHVHFMLDSKWRPVLGKQRQDYLSSLKRDSPLWVSVNECMMSGFEPKPGATEYAFPARKHDKNATGTRLYNSQFTSDPVRVIGLSTLYTRPQGTKL